MILKIDRDMLAKAMGSSQWYFRLDDGTFCCGAAEDECPDSLLIPFPLISQTEIQRAYVQNLNDRTVTNRFRGLPDANYPTLFWKLFDDDGIITPATKYCQNLLVQRAGCFVIVSRRCFGIASFLFRAIQPFVRRIFLATFNRRSNKSDRYYAFEERYCLQAVIAWCRENGIAYRIT